MFETSVIQGQLHGGERKAGLLTLSLAAHGVVIVAMVLAGLHATSFPDQAPKEMSYPLFRLPVTLPPALGTPNAPQHHAAATPTPRATAPAAPTQPAAPQVIPDTATPAASTSATTTGSDTNSGSSSTAETQGVPWGSKDGVGVDGPPSTGIEPSDAPLRVGGEIKAPVVIHRVQPLYPKVALMARMNGTVVVECIIDRNGQVRDARVVRSTFGAFEQPAVDAVRQWVFTPGTLHGQAVDTIFELTVTFRVTS